MEGSPQHSRDVGIDGCNRALEGKTCHRPGGVPSHTGEQAQLFRLRGDTAVVVLDYFPRQTVQIRRASVVP
jgi:hypothetical protein